MAKKEKSAAAEKIAAAEKDKTKKPKSDKPNIFVRIWKAIVRFFKDLRGETKKIVWPDGKTVLKSTGVVLAVVVVFTVVIWLIDLGLSKSIELLSDAARNANNTTTAAQVVDESAETPTAAPAPEAETSAPAPEAETSAPAEETKAETEAPAVTEAAAEPVSE